MSAPYRKSINYVKLVDMRAEIVDVLPKQVRQDLTDAERVELRKLSLEIFGNTSMFIILSDEQQQNPNLKRWEALMSKQLTYQAYEIHCMNRN